MKSKHDPIKNLKNYEWMLQSPDEIRQEPEAQYYGDLTELNTDRTILGTVGKVALQKIAKDTIDLLDSSIAIYEKNGDYATGIFTSGWCRMMDAASRKLCDDCSNKEALESGKWICHESCWDCSKRALEKGEIVDESCEGGINLYAVPIISEKQVIGVLSVGYGNPPEDENTLRMLSQKYHISMSELQMNAQNYKKRPKYIEEISKKRIRSSAELIGLLYKYRKEEQMLRETRRNYNLAIKATELGTWHWNIQTGESTINKYWAQMIGYEKEELEPFTYDIWKHLIHPNDLNICLKEIDQHLSGKKERYECQFRMKHKAGHWIWVQDKGKVFEKTPDGKPLLMYGTHQDITKTKKANQELERFFSLNLDLLCIADIDGNFIKVNKAWEKILGYKTKELEVKKFLDFIHPDDMESTLKAISDLNEQKSVINFINRYRTKDGSYRFLEWHSKPYGKLIYAAAHDITQKILDEKTLRESEEKYRLMFKNSPVGIFNFNEDGVLIDVNESFVRIAGSSREALIGLNMLALPDKAMANAIKQALYGKKGYYNDEYHTLTSGKDIHIRGVFSSIKDHDDHFVIGIGIIEDISDQKKAEKALIKAKEEAQAANRAKSDFLASMSHEIRTPINGVIGFSDLLKSTPLNDTQKEYNNIVLSSAKALLDIINDILDFSKIEAGKLELQPENTNLYQLVDSALNIINYKALENNNELIQSVFRSVPKHIDVDPIRLRQILLNLLSNAVKFTNNGIVELIIRKTAKDPEKKQAKLQFTVKDTGIGIEKENIEKILEPFSQATNFITNKFEGTGLGLAITKSLLEKMGSHLTITRIPNKGSSFTFELTVHYHDSTPKEIPSIKEPPKKEKTKPSSTNKQIMIVEDNEINLQYLETVIKGENKNISVISAEDGEMAVTLFKKNVPELIMMDIQLPNINGYEATKQIRAMDKKVPIIAITARALKGEKEKCLDAGMTDYYSKPISISTIKSILKQYL